MNILLVEDDNTHAELIQRTLGRGPQMTVLRAPNAHRALSLLDQRPIHIVLLDYSLPDRDGLDVLRDIRNRDASLPVIFLTSADSAEVCAKALKGGAADYVVKKRNYLDMLPGIISEVCPAGVPSLRTLDRGDVFGSIIGDSAGVARLRAAVMRAAGSTAIVLIEGETGTGKELVARAIHAKGARARGPFVAVNCTEVAESLFESEFFGHLRGSFTGATSDRKGLFESANGGTILLDEIEDLAPGPQSKLLRVLQGREFKPVGSTRFVPFDARVIAATNRNLERLVEENRFRRDLFFRLDVLRIRVPPLRDRREDISLLARHFVDCFNQRNGTHFTALSVSALQSLARRPWPGNVRELENFVERTLVNSSGDVVDESLLTPDPTHEERSNERSDLVAVLERNRWGRERTARELGISRVTLWRKMSKHGLYD